VSAVVVGGGVGAVATATVVDGVGSISGAGSGACVIDVGVVSASIVEDDISTVVAAAADVSAADVDDVASVSGSGSSA